MSEISTIILRERLPDAMGRPTGWLILRQSSGYAEREILAILSYGIGLELARHYAILLAQKEGIAQILEELRDPGYIARTIEYGVIIQQPQEL